MTHQWSISHVTGGKLTTPIDVLVARLAAGQWGVVTVAQLLECGLSRRAVEIRVAQGHLHRLYRGVYAVGHPNLTREGRFLAAVLACGPGAVLSHYSAAALHELVRWDGRPFDVSAPTKRAHPRVNCHRPTTIERTLVQGIPVTPKLRTVIDLARVADEATVKRALRQAKFTEAELEQLPRTIFDLGAVRTRSEPEDHVFDRIVRAGLEPPEVNPPYRLPSGTVYPDLRWPALRLIVEVDSKAWHADPIAQLADAQRQAELEAEGERVLRTTDAQVQRGPALFFARLRAAGVRDASARGLVDFPRHRWKIHQTRPLGGARGRDRHAGARGARRLRARRGARRASSCGRVAHRSSRRGARRGASCAAPRAARCAGARGEWASRAVRAPGARGEGASCAASRTVRCAGARGERAPRAARYSGAPDRAGWAP